MDDDWGLQAVVRSCAAATTSSTPIPPPIPPPVPPPITTLTSPDALNLQSFSTSFQPQLVEDTNFICFQDLFEPREEKDVVIEELHDLCKPFFFQPSKPQTVSPPSVPVSPLSVLGCFQDLSSQPQPQSQSQLQQQQQLLIQRHIHHPKQQTSSICESRKRESSSNTHNPRSKKRKNQMKKVCQIPAEGLSSDMWSWRKYGQKPIKGSPYPRGYYKCSTSKGCMARKQVERDRSNPNMLIVTYTGEHNHPMPTHRNSLAGSTRQKAATTTSDDPNKPSTPSLDSPAAEKLESIEGTAGEEEDDDDDFDISNMPLDEDFFAGLDDELVSLSPCPGPNKGPSQSPTQNDCFPDVLPATQFPWLSNNVTTTAAGSG